MTDPHLLVSEIADWFAAHVYLPKLRDHVVLDNSIRDAVAKLDPQFGYADAFDQASGTYENLVWAKIPPALLAETAAFARAADVKELLSRRNAPSSPVPASSGDSAPVPNGEPGAAKWRCYTDRA